MPNLVNSSKQHFQFGGISVYFVIFRVICSIFIHLDHRLLVTNNPRDNTGGHAKANSSCWK